MGINYKTNFLAMKKFRVIQAILVLFTALAFTSCGDDELTLEPLGPGGTNAADLKVAFNNEIFVADNVTAAAGAGSITITGTADDTGEVVTMVLNQTAIALETGYHNVSLSYSDGGTEYTNVDTETGEASGTIVITQVSTANHTISGNFAFTGYDTENPGAAPVVFYSGSFSNVTYTGTLAEPTAPTTPTITEYLKAKVAGVQTEFGLLSAVPTSGSVTLTGGILEPLSSISIVVDEDIVAGTYPFAEAPADGPYGIYTSGSTPYTSTGGSLTIISNEDGVIKGSFNFSAANSEGTVIELTDGEFNLELD